MFFGGRQRTYHVARNTSEVEGGKANVEEWGRGRKEGPLARELKLSSLPPSVPFTALEEPETHLRSHRSRNLVLPSSHPRQRSHSDPVDGLVSKLDGLEKSSIRRGRRRRGRGSGGHVWFLKKMEVMVERV